MRNSTQVPAPPASAGLCKRTALTGEAAERQELPVLLPGKRTPAGLPPEARVIRAPARLTGCRRLLAPRLLCEQPSRLSASHTAARAGSAGSHFAPPEFRDGAGAPERGAVCGQRSPVRRPLTLREEQARPLLGPGRRPRVACGHAGEARAEGPPGPGEGKVGCKGQYLRTVPLGLFPTYCGKAPLADVLKGPRITGGTVAQTGAWPWIVSLQIQSGKISAHVCGGSLVKNKWILTAAHCTKDFRDPLMWRAVIGTNNIHEKHPNTKKIKVKTIIIHPDFEIESYVNDIALFHLQRAVTYDDYIQPICLPFDVFQNLDPNTKCFVSGWGRTTEEGNVTNMLQEAEVHYISRNICNSEKSYGNIIPSTSFCAGDEDGVFDTCRGDSGGPLMCYLPDQKQFFVMGITSYGYGCGRKNFPGVYCGPSFYQKWLTDHLYQASNKGIFNINILLGQILAALGSIVLLAIP
ncbi:transmembrane protease serine 12-like [Manis pentadactyla]|uniref:transmembrane protease serine 12-like n=1 Tax=Manis pentadactyla TaxID=143292 RepID=UPI00255C6F10|nr:transmembrane protease serine 12-like [Manis pentadactyla]